MVNGFLSSTMVSSLFSWPVADAHRAYTWRDYALFPRVGRLRLPLNDGPLLVINQKCQQRWTPAFPSNGTRTCMLNLPRVLYHRHLGVPSPRPARVGGPQSTQCHHDAGLLGASPLPPLPAVTHRALSSTNGSGKCTKCGKNTGAVSIKEHIKLYHQEKCILSFPGRTISVKRDADGMWRCPVCLEECGRHPRRLQVSFCCAAGHNKISNDPLPGPRQSQHLCHSRPPRRCPSQN